MSSPISGSDAAAATATSSFSWAKARSSPSAATMASRRSHALAVLGRDRYRLAEAELPGFQHAGLRAARLGLVGDQHHRLAGAPHEVGEGAVVGHDPDPGIGQEEDQIGLVDRRLGLGAHAAFERGGQGVLEAGGVDDVEAQVVEPRRMDAPVARHARRVVDQRQLAADQPVEQGRLADIGPSDDGELEAHGSAGRRRQDAAPEPRISSDISVARWRRVCGAPSSLTIWS